LERITHGYGGTPVYKSFKRVTEALNKILFKMQNLKFANRGITI
jgi:hypothetical protein